MNRAILATALLAAFALSPAAADPPGAAPSAPAPIVPPAKPPPLVPPPGRVANCDGFRPSTPMDRSAEDATLLTVHVDINGLVSNPVLFKPSGDDAYDGAALACAAVSVVPILKHYELPIAIDGVAEVNWRRAPYVLYMNPAMGRPFHCVDFLKPSHGTSELSAAQTLNVRFQIGADGALTNVQIMQSSGFDELDRQMIDCISHWHFYPATHDGKPALIDSSFRIGISPPPSR